jgi:hypothetical protein
VRLFTRFRRRGRFADIFGSLRREQGASGFTWYHFDPRTSETGKRVLAMSPEDLREFSVEAFGEINVNGGTTYVEYYPLYRLVSAVMRRRLPFGEDDLLYMLGWSRRQSYNHVRMVPQIIGALRNYLAEGDPSPQLAREIDLLADTLVSGYADAEVRKWATRLRALSGLGGDRVPLVAGEAWSDAAIADITASEVHAGAWISLLEHCRGASGARPSARWQKETRQKLTALGPHLFAEAVCRWFPLVDKPRTAPAERGSQWMPDPNLMIVDANADVLKGLAWACASGALEADEGARLDVSRALVGLAISAYRKVPQQGPRCVRVGNACVWALGTLPGTEGIAGLALLKAKVKFGTAQKGIEAALTAAGERAGMPREEIEEISVPTYGFAEVGVRRESFGEFAAEAVVHGTNGIELRWKRPDGKAQKSVPKAVKEGFPQELATLKKTLKDVRHTLPAQRDRIEGCYLRRQSWAYPVWRERYLDHPLVGTLARRLIWKFTDASGSATGIFHDGRLVDRRGRRLEDFDDKTRVELWHPIGETPDEVLAWRDWLAELEVKQPFKQAHREVYLLTDAERATDVYSNRFAAHVLRQHQFNALCAARGWKNRLRLMVDDVFPPASIDLSTWGLRAEFWIEGIGDDYDTDATLAGTYLYLSTDQVRFYASGTGENVAHALGGGYGGYGDEIYDPVKLESVPELVFSEVMRDVDLFVGVASVGNDPTWSDGGPEGRFRDYWIGYSFGDLSETAKTRREVLARVVPRLAIADRCHFEERFLVVRGDLRTYRIHLGSGNILMAPNDQYLCIVAGRREDTGGAFLPFEGDGTLAVILSKALMLAEDRKIEDRTITRQIRG